MINVKRTKLSRISVSCVCCNSISSQSSWLLNFSYITFLQRSTSAYFVYNQLMVLRLTMVWCQEMANAECKASALRPPCCSIQTKLMCLTSGDAKFGKSTAGTGCPPCAMMLQHVSQARCQSYRILECIALSLAKIFVSDAGLPSKFYRN